MKRLVLTMLVLAGAAFALLTTAGTASALPPAPADYCGTAEVQVPDSGPSFDFTEACMHHDDCYAAGGSPLDRYRCDQQFLSEMNSWCTSQWNRGDSRLARCKAVAGTYYLGVRLGGWTYFYSTNPV